MVRRLATDIDDTLFTYPQKPENMSYDDYYRSPSYVQAARPLHGGIGAVHSAKENDEFIGGATGRAPEMYQYLKRKKDEYDVPSDRSMWYYHDTDTTEPEAYKEELVEAKGNVLDEWGATHFVGDTDSDRRAAEYAGAEYVDANVLNNPSQYGEREVEQVTDILGESPQQLARRVA